MDPDTCLERIRNLLVLKRLDDDPLVDAVNDLDKWLSKGGFLPREWERCYRNVNRLLTESKYKE